jgi:DNA-binding IclR family transcriptional regulator
MTTESQSSAQRVLRIFEFFDRVERSAGVIEIGQSIGMPRSTAAALISSLVRQGYLSHDRVARSYLPTMKLAMTGRWVESELLGRDRDLLAPLFHDVARKVDETVVLGVQDDLYAQYVHVELAQRPVMYFQRAGARRPMCRSAIGWALLAGLADDELARLAYRHNAHAGDKPVDAGELLATVSAVRRDGFAVSLGAFLPGVAMVAMPLASADKTRCYAIGVGGPAERIEGKLDEIGRALRDCAARFKQLALTRSRLAPDDG